MKRHPLPKLWLLSDARNDAGLERALRRLPRGSGFVFRHYQLQPVERRARYEVLRRLCRARGIVVALAASPREARRWRADASYAANGTIATAHSFRELRRGGRAIAVMLSPVFPTSTHPGAPTLGAARFLLMARQSAMPTIALGGMTAKRARALGGVAWAAIDGLSCR